MKIWITRHGQTELNKARLMQGTTDAPLNDAGIRQAERAALIVKDVKFDAVYASPLRRAIQTAAIVSGKSVDEIIRDHRITEADFGKYEAKKYGGLGLKMSLYWAFPELFPAPDTVETIDSLVERSESFLKEIEKKDYKNVLVVCHGGIIRALKGYLEDSSHGIKWRPKPGNCEITVYESVNGKHRYIQTMRPEK